MVSKCIRNVLVAGLIATLSSGAALAAGGGPEVSVSISGSLNEMLPVLELLRNMGFGFETPADDENALRLEVHSIVRDTDLLKGAVGMPATEASEEAEEAAADKPDEQPVALDKLGLYAAEVDPSTVEPGAKVTVSVVVGDPENMVDTVAASVVGQEGAMADLYDDGTHGDAGASDNTWTCALTLPEDMLSGPYQIEIVAYDEYGDPVEGADGEPLRTRIGLTITK
jgi:hypothetical protein